MNTYIYMYIICKNLNVHIIYDTHSNMIIHRKYLFRCNLFNYAISNWTV